MSHDPALEAHEHAEHAEHAAHARDPFISKVSITVAILAVLAATAGSLETVEGGRAITESSDAVLAQNEATDAWNEYQADSLKRHMYDIAAESGLGHYHNDSLAERAAQDKARAKAEAAEKERDLMTARKRPPRIPPSLADRCGHLDRDRHRAFDRGHHHPPPVFLVQRHRPGRDRCRPLRGRLSGLRAGMRKARVPRPVRPPYILAM